MKKHSLSLEQFPSEIVNYFQDIKNAEELNRATYRSLKKSGKLQYDHETNFAWVIAHSGLPWMPLDLDLPVASISLEALAIEKNFISHRTGGERGYYDGNRGWSAAVLHGISSQHTETFGKYGYATEKQTPYKWTEVAEMCPQTTKYFKEVYPCKEYYRVRFLKLASGGFIYPHTDFAGQNDMLWYTNIAVTNPKGFHFKMDGLGYIPFRPGRAFMLNTSHNHGLVNLDSEDRIHMIVHGMPLRENEFQNLVLRSYKRSCEDEDFFCKI